VAEAAGRCERGTGGEPCARDGPGTRDRPRGRPCTRYRAFAGAGEGFAWSARPMMRDNRIRRLPMALSALVALALAVIPLPTVLEAFRPDFLVLVVFYWSIESPRAGGLTLAFMAGLALDVIQGVVLGQHALALTLTAGWATHLRLRIRVFSILSQCLTIFALLTAYQFVLFWIDGATGNPVTTFGRWLAPVIGALLWPLLVGILSRLHER